MNKSVLLDIFVINWFCVKELIINLGVNGKVCFFICEFFNLLFFGFVFFGLCYYVNSV